MLKRRSRWLAGAAGLFLVLSMSGVAMGVTPPDAEPDADTTATYEDVDGNGIDDDCQAEVAVAAPDAVTAELATVDTNADGVISTTEAAHSPRIGGKNCNHGGYVSWIAQHKHDCVAAPAEAGTGDAGAEDGTEPADVTVVLVVTTPPDAEPDADACGATADLAEDADADSAKKSHAAAAAARLAAKAERKLAHQAAKAERQAAHAASKAERAAAKAAKAAERQAAKAKHKSH